MLLDNVIIEYRDRPEGSESKLNTYSDGYKVLKTIGRLFKNYKPLSFFGTISAILMVLAFIFFIPGIFNLFENRTSSQFSDFNCMWICSFGCNSVPVFWNDTSEYCAEKSSGF